MHQQTSFDPALIQRFSQDGFTVIRGILSPAEVARFRALSLARSAADQKAFSRTAIFTQVVDTWREDGGLRDLTMHPRLIAAAQALCGGPVRLWHDQILTKAPRNGAITAFHQDQPYWPLSRRLRSFAAWIALGDTPEEHGCMSFIPGSHRLRDLAPQDLADAGSLFGLRPDLAFSEAVTVPLRAGDVTFHDGLCAHRAGTNQLDLPRVAHSVIFLEVDAVYDGSGHVVTDSLGLQAGQILPDARFPRF